MKNGKKMSGEELEVFEYLARNELLLAGYGSQIDSPSCNRVKLTLTLFADEVKRLFNKTYMASYTIFYVSI